MKASKLTQRQDARLAGLIYLILVLTGIFSLMYVPSQIVSNADPATTVVNIKNSEMLFKLGMMANVVCFSCFLILPLVLYRLLSPVNKTHAVLMVALSVVSVPISLVNLLNKWSVLTLLGDSPYLSALDTSQIQAQVMLHLDYYNNGTQLASIFWGLWLFPFGYLVYKSGFLPKFFGVFLMLGCFGYVIEAVGSFFYAGYYDLAIASIICIPSSIGEIGICLWLLIVGTTLKRKTEIHD
ncbi:MAG: DUF4386 domain-containing protein [Imperialibacter sp.]